MIYNDDGYFFSVIIPTYNRPNMCIRAVSSVIHQDFKNFEIIIVNDGSVFDYRGLLRFISGLDNIKYYYKANEERSSARNFGIQNATGEWICFLDDDDIYYPNHLRILESEISKVLISRDKYIYCCRSVKRLRNGQIENGLVNIEMYKGIDFLLHDLITTNGVCLHQSITKKQLFNTSIVFWEDFEYWLRIVVEEGVAIKFINKYTSEYVFHDQNSVTWSYESRLKKIQTVLYLKEKYGRVLPFSFFKENLGSLAKTLLDYEVRNKRNFPLKYLFILIKYRPYFLFTRHFAGIIKRVIINYIVHE